MDEITFIQEGGFQNLQLWTDEPLPVTLSVTLMFSPIWIKSNLVNSDDINLKVIIVVWC